MWYIYIYTFLRVCASTRVTSDTWDPISPNVGNTVWAAASNRTPPRSRCCTKATQATRQCFKGGNGKSSLEIHHLMPLMEVISITKMEILTGNPLIVKPSNGERKVSLTHFDWNILKVNSSFLRPTPFALSSQPHEVAIRHVHHDLAPHRCGRPAPLLGIDQCSAGNVQGVLFPQRRLGDAAPKHNW